MSRLLELLHHDSLRIRIAAVSAMGRCSEPQVVAGALVLRFLAADTDRERDAILETWVGLASEDARSLFLWQVSHDSSTHRADPRGPSLGDRAVEGLARLSDQP